MALHLILGPANSGKTGLLNQSLASAGSAEQPILLLPTVPDVRRAHEELARHEVGAARAVEIDAFVDETWALWGDGRRVVDDAGRAVVMRRTLEAIGPSLARLADSPSPGLVDTFCEVAARSGHGLSPSGRRAFEAKRVLDEYRSRLGQAGLIERVQALETLSSDCPLRGRAVGLNRFTDLSTARERFVRALSERNEVFVALDWTRDSAAAEALSPLVTRLFDVAESVTETREASYGAPDLHDLARSVFEGGEPLRSPQNLNVGLARGGEAETLLACRMAADAARGGAGDVVVCFNELASRIDTLRAALAAEDVDFVIDAAIPLASTPFGRALISLVDACARGPRTREHMGAFLLSEYCGAPPGVAEELDTRWRSRRSDASAVLEDAVRAPGVGDLVRRASRARAGALTAERAEEWQKMADALYANSLRRNPSELERSLDAAAHRAVLRTISALSVLDGVAVDFSELWPVVSGAKVTTGTGVERPAILVTEVARVRGRRFDTVVIGGLDAHEFSSERPRTLVSRILESLGQPVGPEDRLLARALFHATVTRARRRLVLVRRESDEGGEALRPSTFFDEVLNVYRSPDDESDDVPEGIHVTRLLLSDAVDSAPRRSGGLEAGGLPPRLGRTTARGRLTDEEVTSALDVDREYSVSEVETYLRCPYRWFFERVLRPKEMDSSFDARAKGTIAHELVARFYSAWQESGRDRVRPETVDDALRLLQEIDCSEAALRERAQGLEERLVLSQAQAWARGIVASDPWYAPGLTPSFHEFRFGEAAGRPVRVGGVRLRGSIDRIDSNGSVLLVTDYKSGSSVPGRRSWEKEQLVQLPLYLHVASSVLELEPVGAVYRSFRGGRPRGVWRSDSELCECGWVSTDRVDRGEMDGIVSVAVDALTHAVGGMRAARIGPEPLSPGACRTCPAARLCGEAR